MLYEPTQIIIGAESGIAVGIGPGIFDMKGITHPTMIIF
jgi:hypothetical protein